MAEDTTICASSHTHIPSKESSEDLDDSLCPVQLKEMNETDRSLLRINGESGLKDIEGQDLYSSVTNGTVNQATFKATDGTVPYTVSSSSLTEEQSQNYNDGSVHNCEGPPVLVADKECDPSVVKDILIDERVSSESKSALRVQDSFVDEKYKICESTKVKESEPLPEISSKRVADINDSLDFESLLDQAEVGNSMSQGISDGIIDKSFLDELLATANNPFLEDIPIETYREGERESVSAALAHPSNPFFSDGTLDESEPNCIQPEETSNNGVVSAKNPFLDNPLFDAAKDNNNKAAKISSNDVAVEGVVHNEPATVGEEKKTAGDGKSEAPNKSSTLDSTTPGAGDKMKVPEHSDNQSSTKQLQHDPLESSFASMNPYPALVSYSGQIPFSGSMSRRSESSATSNRSFAFPVLQTEWNTSPVRMEKANRKHHSWRHTLLCCNF
ncbi:hypothetical protein QQ045_000564 [Rhodiola kirilowii]